MTDRVKHPNIRCAQLAIMDEVSYIQRAMTSELSYPILRERDLIAAARPAMIRHGVTCYPIKSEFSYHGEVPTRSGGSLRLVR